jgi:protein ImuB
MAPFSTEHRDTVERKAREARKENLGEDGQPPRLRSPERSASDGEARQSAEGATAAAPSSQPLLSALRRCRQPVPARVAVADGRPVRVTTDRRGFTGGAVLHAAGPWRTSGEWWTSRSSGSRGSGGLVESGETGHAGGSSALSAPSAVSAPAHAARWNRDEWDVSLGDGAIYRIFQDRETEGWFIDAIVD